MRTYILTEKEKIVIEAYLNKNVKIVGFHQLVERIKYNYRNLQNDMRLIRKLISALGITRLQLV